MSKILEALAEATLNLVEKTQPELKLNRSSMIDRAAALLAVSAHDAFGKMSRSAFMQLAGEAFDIIAEAAAKEGN